VTDRYLSRARLRRDAPAAALAPILLPDEQGQRAGTAHRLLWTLFADRPDRQRDFLWRATGDDRSPGRSTFLVLSERPPADTHGLFEIETKPFAPMLAERDRLAFSLRVNPVVTRKDPQTGRAKRHDVVMVRLAPLIGEQRRTRRWEIIQEAGRTWLEGQGTRHGFCLRADAPLTIDGYDRLEIGRNRGRKPIEIAVLDMNGILEVETPDLFLSALIQGFGKAKAFGCGLMLIKRAA
jgi:CRISPR system Cascade subunit CasE